jgi:hypothetical protein
MSHKTSLACTGAFAAAATLAGIPPANSHTIVGNRVFPATLDIDDPGVNDFLLIRGTVHRSARRNRCPRGACDRRRGKSSDHTLRVPNPIIRARRSGTRLPSSSSRNRRAASSAWPMKKDGATTSGCSKSQNFVCIQKRRLLSTAATKACRKGRGLRERHRNAQTLQDHR